MNILKQNEKKRLEFNAELKQINFFGTLGFLFFP